MKKTSVAEKYYKDLKKASNEIFIQFLWHIYIKINGCLIAEFSKIKHLTGLDSFTFRQNFLAKLEKGFLVPAYTFDNVNGNFPVGFKIWNTSIKQKFSDFDFDVYNDKGEMISTKSIFDYNGLKRINQWLSEYYNNDSLNKLGVMHHGRNDFQSTRGVYISYFDNKDHTSLITPLNLHIQCIYFTVYHCIPANWLNDRDQFLYPNNGWISDTEFQNDCLAFTLFHGQNRISSKEGINHWIPFTEEQVNAREKFDSHFMTDFLRGKILHNYSNTNLFAKSQTNKNGKDEPLVFSSESQAVFDAGLKLWKYYQSKPNVNVNASLYDIREYFQGRNKQGKMNNKSSDEKYNQLIENLKYKLKILSEKIEPKVYKYGFLKK